MPETESLASAFTAVPDPPESSLAKEFTAIPDSPGPVYTPPPGEFMSAPAPYVRPDEYLAQPPPPITKAPLNPANVEMWAPGKYQPSPEPVGPRTTLIYPTTPPQLGIWDSVRKGILYNPNMITRIARLDKNEAKRQDDLIRKYEQTQAGVNLREGVEGPAAALGPGIIDWPIMMATTAFLAPAGPAVGLVGSELMAARQAAASAARIAPDLIGTAASGPILEQLIGRAGVEGVKNLALKEAAATAGGFAIPQAVTGIASGLPPEEIAKQTALAAAQGAILHTAGTAGRSVFGREALELAKAGEPLSSAAVQEIGAAVGGTTGLSLTGMDPREALVMHIAFSLPRALRGSPEFRQQAAMVYADTLREEAIPLVLEAAKRLGPIVPKEEVEGVIKAMESPELPELHISAEADAPPKVKGYAEPEAVKTPSPDVPGVTEPKSIETTVESAVSRVAEAASQEAARGPAERRKRITAFEERRYISPATDKESVIRREWRIVRVGTKGVPTTEEMHLRDSRYRGEPFLLQDRTVHDGKAEPWDVARYSRDRTTLLEAIPDTVTTTDPNMKAELEARARQAEAAKISAQEEAAKAQDLAAREELRKKSEAAFVRMKTGKNPRGPELARLWEEAHAQLRPNKDFLDWAYHDPVFRADYDAAIKATTVPEKMRAVNKWVSSLPEYSRRYAEFKALGPEAQAEITAKRTGESGAAPLELVTLGMSKFIEKDIIPSGQILFEAGKELSRGIRAMVAPATLVEPKKLDAIFKMLGGRSKAAFIIDAAFRQAKKLFTKLGQQASIDFIDRYKRGEGQPDPTLQAIEDAMRLIDEAAWKQAEAEGITIAFKENHYRVLWTKIPGTPEDQVGPQRVVGFWGRRPLRGTRKMAKKSTLEDMSEGIALGGVPLSYNPVEMFEAAQADIYKWITAQRMWNWAKREKVAQFVPMGEKRPEGYVEVEDNIARVYFPAKSGEGLVQSGNWYVEENYGRALNNFLSEDHIRQSLLGRGLMKTKMSFTSAELSFSAFHFMFESLEAVGSMVGVGARQMINLRLMQGKKGQFWSGLKTLAEAPISPYTISKLGAAGRRYIAAPEKFIREAQAPSILKARNLEQAKAALTGAGNRAFLKRFGPAAGELTQDLVDSGLGLGMYEGYRLNTIKTMNEAWAEGNVVGAFFRSPFAANEMVMRPLFEIYIPNLKVGLFLREHALRIQERAKDLAAGRVTRATLARETAAFVDDRFGEMSFDSLFWDNTWKSVAQGMFRSVTWKMGNLRSFSRVIPQQLKEFKNAYQARRAPNLEPGLAWLAGMTTLTTVVGNVISKMFSGKWAHEWDDGKTPGGYLRNVIFPHYDAFDDQKRLGTPTYWKDIVHAIHNPPGYVRSSLSGPVMRTFEVLPWINRDWSNTQIYNPNDPYHQQALDVIIHMLPAPFSISSQIRLWKEGQSWEKQVMGYLGFLKAPAYASQTAMEAYLSTQLAESMKRGAITKEEWEKGQEKRFILEGIRAGRMPPSNLEEWVNENHVTVSQYMDMKRKLGMDPRLVGISSNVIDGPKALEAWKRATPEERQLVTPEVVRKVKQYARLRQGENEPVYIEAKKLGLPLEGVQE